jgi:hypothetical protein
MAVSKAFEHLGAIQGYPGNAAAPPADAFRRHVAISYGDDNPLWCDPDYAAAWRWKSPIAPPPLIGGDSRIE